MPIGQRALTPHRQSDTDHLPGTPSTTPRIFMTDILVSENIQGGALDALVSHYDIVRDPALWKSPDRLLESTAMVRALIVRNQTRVNSELLAHAGKLEIVARAGVGLDNIDVEAASKLGIVVTSTPSANAIAVAELTLGLMFALARHLVPAHRATVAGKWQRQEFTGVELAAKTLGIVGFGRIGTLLAARARACEMRIAVYDPWVPATAPPVLQHEADWMPLDQLLATADVVSCHVPLTADTRNLFGYAQFARMKPSCLFINTSRGGVVAETELARALDERRLAAAALDVRSSEPPSAGPLDGRDNVILTPHIGAFTYAAQQRVVESVAGNVERVLTGQPAIEFANFDRPRR